MLRISAYQSNHPLEHPMEQYPLEHPLTPMIVEEYSQRTIADRHAVIVNRRVGILMPYLQCVNHIYLKFYI